jgi:hypothetical protein
MKNTITHIVISGLIALFSTLFIVLVLSLRLNKQPEEQHTPTKTNTNVELQCTTGHYIMEFGSNGAVTKIECLQ